MSRVIRRALLPQLVIMMVGGVGYTYSYLLPGHVFFATVLGALYFASIAFGPLVIYTYAAVAGLAVKARVALSAVAPFLWMTKEVVRLTESHPLLECLYWYLNPLSFWLVCLATLEMGLGTMLARRLTKKTPAVTLPATVVSAVALGLVVGAYAWGRGENLYVIFLEGYRALFGAGVS